MTITTSGNVVDTTATDGDLWVGNTGAGSLAVNGSSVKSITAANNTAASAEARLWIGKTASGDGTVTVSGAGSVLEVASGGRGDAGATAQVGRGGTGRLTVEAGGVFRVVDTIGAAYNWSTGDGAEAVNIGRDANGAGTLNVNNGTFEIAGTGAFMNIGRAGGTGVANFIAGSTLSLSSTIAAADVGIQIGRGSQGSMLLSASSAKLTGGGAAATPTEDYGAGINVGRDVGGNGTLTLQAGASLVLSGDSDLAGTPGSYAALQIGRDGGTGAMALSSSTVALNNSPEGAILHVGRNAVNGVTTTGTLQLTASTLTLDSSGSAFFGIGRGTGATGTVTVAGGSTITVQGDLAANLVVGTANNSAGSTGGTGTLNINGSSGTGGMVTIQSDNAGSFATASIGQFGGTGTVKVDGGTLRMQGAVNSFMQVGLQVDGGQPGGVAANSAGTGSLILTNGAKFDMADGTGTSGLRLGGGVGNAAMEIRSGSVANLDQGDAAASTFVSVGSGVAGSGVATLLISGSGSRLEGTSFVSVGYNKFDVSTTGGNGRLIVENGGTVVADNGIRIGTGGRLSGNGGTLQVQSGNWVIVADDGSIGDMGGAIQQLTIFGNLGIQDGANARFDISSSTQDRISAQVSTGNSGAVFLGAVDFNLNVLGGYKFSAGESRTLISSGTGASVGLDFNTFPSSSVAINGQHADFSYYLGVLSGGNTFGLTALNSGATGGTSTLDFGASSTIGASFAYNATTNTARVFGGAIAGPGGLTVGVDIVRGTGMNDVFDASQSHAAVMFDGRGGDDTLLGGAGDDGFIGGAGADVIDGGQGFDTLSFQIDSPTVGQKGIYVDLASGFAQDNDGFYDTVTGIEAVIGTNELRSGTLSDVMIGDDGNNVFYGLGGQDYILGGGGDDIIDVGSGQNNIALGGTGNDSLRGGADADFLYGQDGSDTLEGGGGNDWLFGGDFSGSAITGADSIYGGDGDDVIAVGDKGGSLAIGDGGAGNDIIYGGANANDTIRGGTGSDYMYGNTGADTYTFFAGDLVSGDADSIFAFNAQDRFVFDESYSGRIGVVAGSNQDVPGVYLYDTGSTWIAWLPYLTASVVQTQIQFTDFAL